MKRLLNKAILLALMAVTWVGCSQDEVIVDCDVKINTTQESESYIPLSLNLNIPDPIRVTSRGGITEAIENITILCFDKDGNALEKIEVTPNNTDSVSVKIKNATRVMHVFANQETVPFEKGMSEYVDSLKNVQATTKGKMVYWGRMEVPVTTSGEMKEWAKTRQSINLLRSQAKVEVKNNNTKEFTLSGYTVVNTNASGMAIPYYADEDVYPTNALEGYTSPVFSVDNWKATNYVHAYTKNGTVSQTDVTHTEEESIYVYETSDNTNSPASIIIKGYNNSDPENIKYWRVEFANAKGEKYDIRRNHCYKVSIEGHILNGYSTFADALAGDPIGIKVDVADEVTAIKNSDFSMTLENTSYVLADGAESLSFNFVIEQLGTAAINSSELTVKWEDGQNVSSDETVVYTFNKKDESGKIYKGTVDVNLLRLAANAENQEGTIVINYAERLERKVKVIVIPQQQFNIVSYNGVTSCTTDENGALVYTVSVNKDDYEKDEYTIDGAPIDKLKFKLPSGFPTQLLPVNILVSTTDFNVVNSPLIFEGAGGYGEKNDIGYKYVYPVSAVGTEYEISLRYINNKLTDKVELTLEAENFKPVKLIINYTTESSKSDDTEEGGSTGGEGSEA